MWWKNVDVEPPKQGAVTLDGDPKAISKRWPIIWRFGQNWQSLMIRVPHIHSRGYRAFFSSGGVTMMCRRELVSLYIMVRIGPDPVTFWVEDHRGVPGELVLTEGMMPGLLRKDVSQNHLEALAIQRTFGGHTFI
jgi:hypothetical protein